MPALQPLLPSSSSLSSSSSSPSSSSHYQYFLREGSIQDFEKPTIHRWLFSGGLLCTILSSTIWDYYSPRTPLDQFHQQSCYSATVVITKISPFCHYCKGNWKGLLLWTEDIKTKGINTETVFLMHWRLLVHSWTAHFIMKMAKMSLQTWCDRLWTLKNGRNHIVKSMYSPLYHTFPGRI